MSSELFGIDELSQYLKVPKATIYSWTHQKRIPHMKLGRVLRFDRAEIDGWLGTLRVRVLQFE